MASHLQPGDHSRVTRGRDRRGWQPTGRWHRHYLGGQWNLSSRRPGGWTRSLRTTWHETGRCRHHTTDGRTTSRRFAIDRPPTDTTGDVDTISTDIGTGSRPWNPHQSRPVTPEVDYQMRRPPTETRQGYRPAAPIQRFNNKSLKLAGVV